MDRTNILLIIGLLCVKGEIIANSKSCGFFIDKEDIFVSAKIHKDTLAEDSITKVSHPYFMGTLGLKCFVSAHKYKKLTLT